MLGRGFTIFPICTISRGWLAGWSGIADMTGSHIIYHRLIAIASRGIAF